MPDENTIRVLLRSADGKAFRFRFTDGQTWVATVVDVSHLDLDDTVLVDRVGTTDASPVWNVRLSEIAEVVPVAMK